MSQISGAAKSGKIAFALFALVFISALSSTRSCYLKNCPLGKREGKRNDPERNGVTKLCPRCGPDGLGRCVGPHICCTRKGGCIIGVGSPDTAPCRTEQNSPTPCVVDEEAYRCGPNGEGYCASNGVCCTEGTCMVSAECGYPTLIGTETRIKAPARY